MGDRRAGPEIRDWALFAVALIFVLLGMLMLRDKPREAALPLLFFGACLVVFTLNIHRKLRRRDFIATAVSVPGGVKLRASNGRALLLVALTGIPGIAALVAPAPIFIHVCGVIMVGAGLAVLYKVVRGQIARRFLRFDPPGLTIGELKFEYLVPWDAVVNVAEFERVDNACVGFDVADRDAIVVTPPERRLEVFKLLGKSAAFGGRDVVFMAAHFNVPAEALAAAIRRYAEDSAARAELGAG